MWYQGFIGRLYKTLSSGYFGYIVMNEFQLLHFFLSSLTQSFLILICNLCLRVACQEQLGRTDHSLLCIVSNLGQETCLCLKSLDLKAICVKTVLGVGIKLIWEFQCLRNRGSHTQIVPNFNSLWFSYRLVLEHLWYHIKIHLLHHIKIHPYECACMQGLFLQICMLYIISSNRYFL